MYFLSMQLIITPIVAIMINSVKLDGPFPFAPLWALGVIVSLLNKTVYQSFIAPMFETFKPVPDGTLKTKIQEMATLAKFPLVELFIAEGKIFLLNINR